MAITDAVDRESAVAAQLRYAASELAANGANLDRFNGLSDEALHAIKKIFKDHVSIESTPSYIEVKPGSEKLLPYEQLELWKKYKKNYRPSTDQDTQE